MSNNYNAVQNTQSNHIFEIPSVKRLSRNRETLCGRALDIRWSSYLSFSKSEGRFGRPLLIPNQRQRTHRNPSWD
ncbi:hypothetical protein NE237_016853 [Protea cynaroides]|uniref:Uncharacterized protein n=1 Tax=Protea cynaroides TaxID=273540 RepID=A0A9Q0HJ35_9MAGN|nr:hypothetical protein NE237_016853 [Protea cynaroides]